MCSERLEINKDTVAGSIHLADRCDEYILDMIPTREYNFHGSTKPILYHHPHDILEYVMARNLFDARWVDRANDNSKHPAGYKGFKEYDTEFKEELKSEFYKLILFNLWVDGFDAIKAQNFCSIYVSFANVGSEVIFLYSHHHVKYQLIGRTKR